MNRPVEGRVTGRPAAVLLRAGALPGVIVGGVLAAACTLASGEAALSVLMGSLLAIVALSAGPALLAVMRSLSPPAAMLMAMIVYGAVVVVLAVLYLELLQVSWIAGGYVGAGIGAVTTAFLVGLIRAVPRLRIPIFGAAETPRDEAGGAGQGGSPASPSGPSH